MNLKRIIREEIYNDWEWTKEIPGTDDFGQEYKYFEVIACRGFNDVGECDDEYSYFIKIPKDKADKMWSHEIGYLVLAEPPINAHLDVTDYEGATEVISYTVYNNIIPQRELEEIVMFKGVREIDEEIGRLRLGESKRLNESDWEWVKKIGFPETLTFNKEAHLQAGKDTFGTHGTKFTTHHHTNFNWSDNKIGDTTDFIRKGATLKIDPNSVDGDYAEYKGFGDVRGLYLDDIKIFRDLGIIQESIKESDDFQWIKDIEVETDLTPSQIVNRYESAFPIEVVGPKIHRAFGDLYYEGGKYILKVDGWCDFTQLFKDNDSGYGYYGYMGKSLAEKVLCDDDDYWEPYDSHDLVYDWFDQVWSMVARDKELYNYVVDWIGDNLVGDEMLFDRKETTLTKEDVFEWSADSDVLGQEIDELDVFEDLKINLTWAYGSAYNNAARDEIYNSAIGAIMDIFGKGEWESEKITMTNNQEKTIHKLAFDVTGLVDDAFVEVIEDCWANCRRYWSPYGEYPDENGISQEEAFEDYCHQCVDYPFNEFSDFIDFLEYYLDDRSDLLNPRFDENPDESKIYPYFIEDAYGRF